MLQGKQSTSLKKTFAHVNILLGKPKHEVPVYGRENQNMRSKFTGGLRFTSNRNPAWGGNGLRKYITRSKFELSTMVKKKLNIFT